MKFLDILAAVLLVIGGLNWGLWGLFELNLVSEIGGVGSTFSTFVYALVGMAAIYQVIALRSIQRRWNVAPVTV